VEARWIKSRTAHDIDLFRGRKGVKGKTGAGVCQLKKSETPLVRFHCMSRWLWAQAKEEEWKNKGDFRRA